MATDFTELRIFDNLNATEVHNLTTAAKQESFSVGDVLVDPEVPAERLLILTEGEAKVTHHGRDLATITAPGVVGEMEFLNRTYRPARVEAKTPIQALAFSFRQLEARVADGDVATLGFFMNIARVLATRLVAMNTKFSELSNELDADDPRTSDLLAFQRQLFCDWDI